MTQNRSLRFGRVILGLAIAVALTGAAQAERIDRGAFDGMAFVGETGPSGRGQGQSDEFVFNGGTFRNASFAEYGYSGARYKATPIEGGIRFTAEVVSNRSGGGSMVWQGTLRGDVLEGTMRWNHGWESKSYWFRGHTKTTTTASR